MTELGLARFLVSTILVKDRVYSVLGRAQRLGDGDLTLQHKMYLVAQDRNDILEFRDQAFDTYFTHQPYLDLVQNKFGPDVVDHIERMRAIPLARKLLEERNAA